MAKHDEEASDESAYASRGFESFPPTYSDSLDVRNFSDLKKWPDKKLIGRYALYATFLKREDLMPHAREAAERIMLHMDQEFPHRGIVVNIPDGEDCPTESIDTQALREMLGEQS